MEKQKGGRKKKICAVCVLAVLLIAGAVAVVLYLRKQNTTEDGQEEKNGMWVMSEDAVTASGVTALGMTEDRFEVENLETALYIEEVYVSGGSSMEAGDPVLKLSEESVEAARTELEEVLSDADLKYRAGLIEYEQSRITAKYTYDAAVLSGSQAKEEYEEALANLSQKEEEALETLTQTQEKIAEYQEALENDTYAEDYPYEELKALYEENYELLHSLMEAWEITDLTASSQSAGPQGASGAGAGSSVPGKNDPYGFYLVLNGLSDIVEQNEKDYEEAEEQYEAAVKEATLQLTLLQLQLSGLEADYAQAQADAAEGAISAKLTYETTLAAAEQAERDYETALQKAEATLEELSDARDEAEENLTLFEDSVGDGYFYAGSSGTVMMTVYRAGDTLQSDSMVIAYSNREDITVTVSVDQDDIARLTVGETAYVMISGYGNYEGSISEINPVSSSDSRTTVTYEVTVKLGEDAQTLSANLSATVIFGAELPAGDVSGNGPGGQNFGDGEMPEGFGDGEMPQMPEGFEDGEMPQMPEGFEDGEMPQMPEGFGDGEMPQMPQGAGNSGFPQSSEE